MAGTEELMARLTQLENSYNADRQAAREKQFFDTYGGRFSNNRGLGLAILNELDARGIDTSAADEAVQQILDQLRTECNEILELTKEANEAAIQTAQKVEDVANVVSQAVASNPDASMPMTPPPGVESAEVPPAIEDINPDGEFNPDNVPPAEGGTPEEQTTEGTEGTEGTEEQPAEGTEVPPAEDTEVSDIRQKRISRMKSNWGKTHTQKKMEARSFKPSAGMIEAASKGY
ncbi:MAG: hypothetical protein UIM53_03950 [Acutalibacteraceae bacterium]|nr:hypothetical protein [Acutalibacteraceae bacterium]